MGFQHHQTEAPGENYRNLSENQLVLEHMISEISWSI